MKILALDQSTSSTGYAIFEDGERLSSGVFSPPKSFKGKLIGQRIFWMYDQIKEKLVSEKVDKIVFEDTTLNRIQNVDTLKWLSRLQGCVMGLCFENNKEFQMLYPTEWRSSLGFLKGKSKKETNRECMKICAIEYVNKEYNLSLSNKDDDQAEAICLGKAFWIMKG